MTAQALTYGHKTTKVKQLKSQSVGLLDNSKLLILKGKKPFKRSFTKKRYKGTQKPWLEQKHYVKVPQQIKSVSAKSKNNNRARLIQSSEASDTASLTRE